MSTCRPGWGHIVAASRTACCSYVSIFSFCFSVRLRFNVLSIDFVLVTNCFYDYYDYDLKLTTNFDEFICILTSSKSVDFVMIRIRFDSRHFNGIFAIEGNSMNFERPVALAEVSSLRVHLIAVALSVFVLCANVCSHTYACIK